MFGKIKIVTRRFRMRLHASNFGIQFLSRNFKVINSKRLLLKIFDAEFPHKLSYFEPLCLLNKMAAKTVKRSITNIV